LGPRVDPAVEWDASDLIPLCLASPLPVDRRDERRDSGCRKVDERQVVSRVGDGVGVEIGWSRMSIKVASGGGAKDAGKGGEGSEEAAHG
jgi:hypothetical protein